VSKEVVHVIVATNEYFKDGLRYRRHRLAEYLKQQSSTKEVIWVCPSDDKYGDSLTTLENGIKQYGIKDLLPNRSARFMRYYDMFYMRRLAGLKKILNQYKSQTKHLWFTFPGYPGMFNLMSWDKVVYDCSDLWAAPIGGKKSLKSKLREESILGAENRIIDRADIIFCTSDYLGEKIKEKSGNTPVQVIENGVEFHNFQQAKPLNDERLKKLSRPILGYVGGVKPKTDFEVVKKIASAHPNWNIVFIGPDGTNGDKLFKNVLELKNVYWLGSVNPSDVPSYMKYLDVGIMPYKDSIYNRAVFPLKLFEYLAVGVPVVGKGLPSTKKYVKEELYYYADNNDEFLLKCEKASSERNLFIHDRVDYAKENDWAQKFDLMFKKTVL
jgi:teichuronic acid biosynthesis glycosyltransferase TuaH